MDQIHWKSAAFALLAFALPVSSAADDNNVMQLQQQLDVLTQRYEEQARLIQRLESRLQELELGKQRGRGGPSNEVAQSPAAEKREPSPPLSGPVREPQQSTVVEQITQQEHAPLFDRRFALETGVTYARFDRRLLTLSGFLALDAIFLGQINLQQTRSDAFTFDLTGRYGLTDRLSIDTNVPWLYRRSSFIEGGAGSGAASTLSQANVSANSIGDVNGGLYYQIWRETDSWPDVVGSVRLRAPTGQKPYGIKFEQDPNNSNLIVPDTLPTGSGVWSAQLGFSVLKTSDPLVLFANVGYNYNFERHFNDISPTPNVQQPGQVSLGDSWQWGAGFAVAFNERASVSFSLSHQIGATTKVKPDGQQWHTVVGSDFSAATFQTGLTYQLSDALFMIWSVGMGITPDAPDFTVGVKFPYRF